MQDIEIKVLCRLRPGSSSCIGASESQNEVVVSQPFALRHSINSNSSQKSLETERVSFGGVIKENAKQSEIFEEYVESSIIDMLTGKSLCLITLGTSGSGKSFTMRGGEGKKRGILLRSVEKLLSVLLIQRDRYELRLETSVVQNQQIFNLLDCQSTRISTVSDLHNALHKSLRNRKSFGRSSLHLLMRVSLFKGENLVSQADFVELSAFETGFSSNLADYLRSKNPSSDTLFNFLHSTVSRNATIILLCCVSTDSESFHESLPALRYASSIHTDNVKRSFSYSVSQSDLLNLQKILSLQENFVKISQQMHSKYDTQKTRKVENDGKTRTLVKLQMEKAELKNALEETQSQLDYLQSMNSKQIKELKQEISKKDKEIIHLNQTVEDLKFEHRERYEHLIDRLEDKQLELKESQKEIEKLKKNLKCQENREDTFFASDKSYEIGLRSVKEILEYFESFVGNDYLTRHMYNKVQDLEQFIRNQEKKHLASVKEQHTISKNNASEYLSIDYLNDEISKLENEKEKLQSLVEDYKTAIYDLKKMNLVASNENKEISYELQQANTECERLRKIAQKHKESETSDLMRAKEELKVYKDQSEKFVERSENASVNIENLKLELLNINLKNNQLEIDKSELSDKLGGYAKVLEKSQTRFDKIYQWLDSLESNCSDGLFCLKI